MEIQSQTVIASVANGTAAGGASGSAGNTASNGTQAAFASTLSGMMSENQGQDGTATAGLSGIPALVQLLTPFLFASPAGGVQSANLSAEQVGVLADLLEQPGQSDALLSNPDLQAWLLQLQSLVAVLMQNQQANNGGSHPLETATTEGNAADVANASGGPLPFVPLLNSLQTTDANMDRQSSGISLSNEASGEGKQVHLEDAAASIGMLEEEPNPLLFVPIGAGSITDADDGDGTAKAGSQTAITTAQAVQLLHQLKDLIKSGSNEPELKQIIKELPAILMSAAAAADKTQQTRKSFIDVPLVLHTANPANASADNGASSLKDLVQVIPNKPHQLEILAVKNAQLLNHLETAFDDDKPLFEPLGGNEGSEPNVQPITVQEFMRQAQAGHPAKVPVLHMSAPAFANDMTQFVVSSFMMEASADGFTEAKISLYPQHLGHVDVKLTMHNGQLVAQFVADSLVGKETLENQLSQLRTALQNSGIQVEKLEVTQSQGFQSGMFQDGRQQQQPGQSSKQQKSAGTRSASMDEISLEESKDAAASVRTAGLGSIDTTA